MEEQLACMKWRFRHPSSHTLKNLKVRILAHRATALLCEEPYLASLDPDIDLRCFLDHMKAIDEWANIPYEERLQLALRKQGAHPVSVEHFRGDVARQFMEAIRLSPELSAKYGNPWPPTRFPVEPDLSYLFQLYSREEVTPLDVEYHLLAHQIIDEALGLPMLHPLPESIRNPQRAMSRFHCLILIDQIYRDARECNFSARVWQVCHKLYGSDFRILWEHIWSRDRPQPLHLLLMKCWSASERFRAAAKRFASYFVNVSLQCSVAHPAPVFFDDGSCELKTLANVALSIEN